MATWGSTDYRQLERLRENAENLEQCRKHGCDYLLIDAEYPQEIILNV